MSIDLDEFSRIFLNDDSLLHLVCHLCNQSLGHVSDPITETLTIIATTPLTIVITEAGVAMFKNQPTMVLPYNNMTAEQLLYVKGVVDSIVEKSTDDNMQLKRHVQMGGGCIVMVPIQTRTKDLIVDSKDLLQAFVRGVAGGKQYNNWTKKALCNIILQRLSCTVNLSKEHMLQATTFSASLFSESQIPVI
jgi:hypothetical protein